MGLMRYNGCSRMFGGGKRRLMKSVKKERNRQTAHKC